MPEYRLTRLRGEWAVGIWQDGKRLHRHTLGTTDRKTAEQKLARLEADLAKPKHITVSYIWQQYRTENAEKRISENMKFSGKAILPEFGHLTPDEITDPKCRAYAAKRKKAGRKPGTTWTEMNHLQTALNWAADKRIIPYAVKLAKPMKPAPRNRRLTKAEGRRLLKAAASPHIATAIALMLGTGGRVGAILDLTWERVDMEAGLIHLADPEATGRRKGRATVPMTADLKNRLTEARRGALTEWVIEWAGEQVKSIKRGFATAVDNAGLKKVTPHVLRHTAATWMAEGGRPMSEIAAVLGHSDSRTTERIYAKYTPGHLRKTIDTLDMSEVPPGSDEPTDENET